MWMEACGDILYCIYENLIWFGLFTAVNIPINKEKPLMADLK